MIYRRAFVSETFSQSLLVLSLLGVILLLFSATRALADLAEVGVGFGSLALLVVLGVLRYLPLLISVCILAGLLATFDRMRGEREMLFWTVAGVSPVDWMGPVFRIAGPAALLCTFMALEGAPWSTRTLDDIKRREIDNAQIVGHTGSFGEISRLGIVYHITDNRTVLLQQRDNFNNIVIADGGLASGRETRALDLTRGRMYSSERFGQRFYKIGFDGGYLAMATPEKAVNPRIKSTALSDLNLDNRRAQAELAWRISLPVILLLSAALMPFAACRNQGMRAAGSSRIASILIATLTYWLLYSIAGLMKELGAQSETLPGWGFAPLPLLALAALLAVLMLRRERRASR